MKVVIDFAFDASIIEFTPFLGENIEKYIKAFEDWYYEIEKYGRRPRSDLKYEYFNVDVIIDWIKEVAPEANPRILVRRIKPDEVDPELPGMYF